MIAQAPPLAPISGATPENLAYVIYTSGSTGRPKGVAIPHRNVAARLSWTQSHFTPDGMIGVLATTSISFDVSVFELFVPLSMGGTVILATSPLALAEMPVTAAIRVLSMVPAAMIELLRLGALPPRVHTIQLAGEPLPPALIRQLYQQPAIQQVLNFYGPTEDTVYSTWAVVQRDTEVPPPIGRPLANTQIYLLDDALQPVPIGVAGELYIGGAGQARGYLNRPDLTAERFIPNPFAGVTGVGCWVTGAESSNTQHPTPNTRLYRTGDLARYRPDGQIEFLGRIDHQVKVRGFRVELGEIEAVLAQHPQVRRCLVLARGEGPGERRLVAYAVMRTEGRGLSGADSSVLSPQSSVLAELRTFLQTKLPDYMVPSAFMVLDALPLTPSGKVDRRALSLSDSAQIELERPFVAPRDTLELQLVQIWEAILQVHPISITDDFFTLGGHSLLTLRLVEQIKRRIERPLALSALFQAPTIEQLARLLRRQPGSQRRSALVPIQPDGSKQPFFCVHPVGGGIICYAELSRQLGADQPFYGLEAIGLDENQPVQTRIEEMAATYIDALQAVRPSGPYFLGGWSFGGVVALEMAQQLQQQGQEVALLALFDSWAPGTYTGFGEQSDATLLLQFIEDIGGISGKDMRTLSDRLAHDVPGDPLRYIVEQAGDAGLFPLDTDDAYILRLFEVYKSNYRALSRYQARPYAIPTFLFRACEEVAQNPHEITLGWDQLSADPVEVRTVPGDHFSILTRPHVQLLAEQLKACLESKQLHGPGHPGPQTGFSLQEEVSL